MPALRNSFCTLVIAALIAGCGTRSVTPMAMMQPGDDRLDCPAIIEQIKVNRPAMATYLTKDKQVEQANVFFVLIGPTFLIDLSNEEQIKARALADRNDRLVLLGRAKGCTEP